MNVDPPVPGTVFRYSYVWSSEANAGRTDGRKDRPATILSVAIREKDGRSVVLALPITHSPPADATEAVEIPPSVKRALGLDDRPSFVVTIDANIFTWPGSDLRAVPGRQPPTTVYGRLPVALTRKVAEQVLRNREHRLRIVRRTS